METESKKNDTSTNPKDESKKIFHKMLLIVFIPSVIPLLSITVLPEEMMKYRVVVWISYVLLMLFVAIYLLVIRDLSVKRKAKRTVIALYWIAVCVVLVFCFLLNGMVGEKEDKKGFVDPPIITSVPNENIEDTVTQKEWEVSNVSELDENNQMDLETLPGIDGLDLCSHKDVIRSFANELKHMNSTNIPQKLNDVSYYPYQLEELQEGASKASFKAMADGQIYTVFTNIGNLLFDQATLSYMIDGQESDSTAPDLSNKNQFTFELPRGYTTPHRWSCSRQFNKDSVIEWVTIQFETSGDRIVSAGASILLIVDDLSVWYEVQNGSDSDWKIGIGMSDADGISHELKYDKYGELMYSY